MRRPGRQALRSGTGTGIALAVVLAIVLAVAPVRAQDGETFTSADILQAAIAGASENCLDYCITGICFWLKCKWSGCKIKTTPQIEHFLPDLVVTAHKTPGDLPWTEAAALYGAAAAAAASSLSGTGLAGGGSRHVTGTHGSGEGETARAGHENLLFRDVSVIGSPVVAAFARQNRIGPRSGYLCRTPVRPMMPYFLSELDHLVWRGGALSGPEVLYPASFIPGRREVGRGAFRSWGPVHPRTGFLHANEEPKGAAVMAQRGMDIATRHDQPHVYQPAPVDSSNEDIDKWQMVSPVAESRCAAFGTDPQYGLNRASTGNYGWLYWGQHECCIRRSGKFLGSVDTSRVCLN